MIYNTRTRRVINIDFNFKVTCTLIVRTELFNGSLVSLFSDKISKIRIYACRKRKFNTFFNNICYKSILHLQ